MKLYHQCIMTLSYTDLIVITLYEVSVRKPILIKCSFYLLGSHVCTHSVHMDSQNLFEKGFTTNVWKSQIQSQLLNKNLQQSKTFSRASSRHSKGMTEDNTVLPIPPQDNLGIWYFTVLLWQSVDYLSLHYLGAESSQIFFFERSFICMLIKIL